MSVLKIHVYGTKKGQIGEGALVSNFSQERSILTKGQTAGEGRKGHTGEGATIRAILLQKWKMINSNPMFTTLVVSQTQS
jgi:hypothetical protein